MKERVKLKRNHSKNSNCCPSRHQFLEKYKENNLKENHLFNYLQKNFNSKNRNASALIVFNKFLF